MRPIKSYFLCQMPQKLLPRNIALYLYNLSNGIEFCKQTKVALLHTNDADILESIKWCHTFQVKSVNLLVSLVHIYSILLCNS